MSGLRPSAGGIVKAPGPGMAGQAMAGLGAAASPALRWRSGQRRPYLWRRANPLGYAPDDPYAGRHLHRSLALCAPTGDYVGSGPSPLEGYPPGCGYLLPLRGRRWTLQLGCAARKGLDGGLRRLVTAVREHVEGRKAAALTFAKGTAGLSCCAVELETGLEARSGAQPRRCVTCPAAHALWRR